MTRILLLAAALALGTFAASTAEARMHHRHHGFHHGGHITTDYTNHDRQLVGTR